MPANRSTSPDGGGRAVAPPRPAALIPEPDGIPAELRDRARWLVWRYELKAGHAPDDPKPWTKVPYRADGNGKAASNRPATWADFEAARRAYDSGEFDGLGFVTGDGVAAGDVDDCRDPSTGELTPEAERIIRDANTYTEWSPSGAGLRFWAFTDADPGARKRHGNVELYPSKQYLTVTGHHVDGTPTTVENRTAELKAIHDAYLAPRAKPKQTSTRRRANAGGNTSRLADDQVLTAMFDAKNGAEARRLYDGDTSAHKNDHSAADLALCGHLGFWCDYDAAQVDRLFRGSKLMRDKWDEQRGAQTYGERTIGTAFEGHAPGDGYQPSAPKSSGPPPRDDSDPGPGDADAPSDAAVATSDEITEEWRGDDAPAKKATKAKAPAEIIRAPMLTQLSTVEREAVERLDGEGRLMIGKTTIMLGDPGVGKTFLSLSIAANITRGLPPIPVQLSPESRSRPPANVLALIGEDGLGDTIRARFEDAGGDAERFWAVTGIMETSTDARTAPKERDLDLMNHDEIEDAVQQTQPLLVIVDPLTHFFGAGSDANKGTDVRANLRGVVKLAERYRFALLIVHHMNKSAGGKAIYRGVGSIDFAAFARSMLIAAEHEGAPALAQSKTNLGPKAPTLTYRINTGRLEWTGKSDVTADQLTGPPPSQHQAPARATAADWLESKLSAGPLPVETIKRLADVEGIASWRTINAAKADVDVGSRLRYEDDGTTRYWEWFLER